MCQVPKNLQKRTRGKVPKNLQQWTRGKVRKNLQAASGREAKSQEPPAVDARLSPKEPPDGEWTRGFVFVPPGGGRAAVSREPLDLPGHPAVCAARGVSRSRSSFLSVFAVKAPHRAGLALLFP